MTDQELYQGIQTGDATALRYVYDRYYASVAHLVRATGGGDDDAFDVFQDSVVALYLNIETGRYTVREDSRLSTYLHGIAKNIWRAKQRKARKLATISIEKAPVGQLSEEQSDEELLARIEHLGHHFNQLGNKCRRLLRLFYYERLPLKRIAELMTFTEKTVKNNKYRCMQELRARMSQPAK